MSPSEPIRHGLQMTEAVTVMLAETLRDHPLTPSTPKAKGGEGNHPIWTLGHLALAEANIPNVISGEPNPLEKWWPLFGMGTECKYTAANYPAFDEVLQQYRTHRAATLKLLDQIGDKALDDKPVNIPKGFEREMRTVGHLLTTMAVHNMMHVGQLSDMRRVAGLKRLF